MNKHVKKCIQRLFGGLGYKVVRNIYRYDPYDPHTRVGLLLKNIAAQHPVIFDVGANSGQSIALFKKHFAECDIHSFEPDQNTFKELCSNYGEQQGIYLNNFALGDRDARLTFFRSVSSDLNSIYEINKNSEWYKRVIQNRQLEGIPGMEEAISVPVKTIDGYCRENGISNIDILKIDTQGYEDKCLKGALGLIRNKNIGLIIIEIILGDLYEHSLQVYDIERHLVPDGYKLFCIINSISDSVSGRLLQLDLAYSSE